MNREQKAAVHADRADAGGLLRAWCGDHDGAREWLASMSVEDAARMMGSVLAVARDLVQSGDLAAARGELYSPSVALDRLIATYRDPSALD